MECGDLECVDDERRMLGSMEGSISVCIVSHYGRVMLKAGPFTAKKTFNAMRTLLGR